MLVTIHIASISIAVQNAIARNGEKWESLHINQKTPRLHAKTKDTGNSVSGTDSHVRMLMLWPWDCRAVALVVTGTFAYTTVIFLLLYMKVVRVRVRARAC